MSAYAGAERRVAGVLSVPKWQPGIDAGVLPREYRDILEVVSDAPGPVRAKQIVPRIGLPVRSGKIEGTRAKLKRPVERGWLDEDDPGLFAPARRRRADSSMPRPGQCSSAARPRSSRHRHPLGSTTSLTRHLPYPQFPHPVPLHLALQ
ncbi:hypothetical protein GCM10009716_41580 [Streptomyces sodiiphilus]|uniref:Uncharacterized protein n=1 Tax=Streptomyces sodiiphilus TaxID=226217 RepID=A0ABN2PR10_9ACTN